jgi:hypothetical protein
MVLKGDATKPELLFAGVVVKSEIFPSLTKRVANDYRQVICYGASCTGRS